MAGELFSCFFLLFKLKTMLKQTKISITIAIVLFSLTSCLHKNQVLKHEKGFVIEKQYFPDTRETAIGTGVSSSGSIVTTVHAVGEDEKYIVLFKCEHNVVFSINRNDLYTSLNKGDSVNIQFYEMLNSNNEVVEFDFINAKKYDNN